MRFSNTRFFYEQGWKGLCIDPMPGSSKLFLRQRPRDTFVEIGVAETEKESTYFIFSESALNTFSEEIASRNLTRVTARKTIKVYPLRRILAEHLPPGRTIDFLSIDAEGLDPEVLRSNDWTSFRPLIVLIEETSHASLTEVQKLESAVYMEQQGYLLFARTPGALFFMDERSPARERTGYLIYDSDKLMERDNKRTK